MGSGMLLGMLFYLDRGSDGVRHVIGHVILFRQRCSVQRCDQVKAPIKTGRKNTGTGEIKQKPEQRATCSEKFRKQGAVRAKVQILIALFTHLFFMSQTILSKLR
jgi:hypothetical protein